jgi:hypothetical protein
MALPAPGVVGMGPAVRTPAGVVPELNRHDQGGVHRGEDWEPVTVVSPIVSASSNHSPASAEALGDLDSRVSGVLTAGQTDWYQVTVPASGRLTAQVSTYQRFLSAAPRSGLRLAFLLTR